MDFDIDKFSDWRAARRFAETFHSASNFPYAYAFATFLTLSGVVLGRNVSLWHHATYFPNFYVCLVGPSGRSRKSTVMNYGVNSLPLYYQVQPELTSWLGFLEKLDAGGGKALIHLDELATILNTSKKEYAKEIINKLTEVYATVRPIGNYSKKSPIEIKEPHVSILAASTVEWIQATMTMGDVLGGFGNRMTWVLGSPRLENPDPKPPGVFDWSPLEGVCERPYYFTSDARETYITYERRFQDWQETLTPVERILAERIPEKVLKTALVRAVWDGLDAVEEYALLSAIEWGAYLQECVHQLAPQFEPPDRRIMAAIENGCRTKRGLSREMGHIYSNRQIKEVLDHLRWVGSIEVNGDKIKPC